MTGYTRKRLLYAFVTFLAVSVVCADFPKLRDFGPNSVVDKSGTTSKYISLAEAIKPITDTSLIENVYSTHVETSTVTVTYVVGEECAIDNIQCSTVEIYWSGDLMHNDTAAQRIVADLTEKACSNGPCHPDSISLVDIYLSPDNGVSLHLTSTTTLVLTVCDTVCLQGFESALLQAISPIGSDESLKKGIVGTSLFNVGRVWAGAPCSVGNTIPGCINYACFGDTSVCLQCDANMVPNSNGTSCEHVVGGCPESIGCQLYNLINFCGPSSIYNGLVDYTSPVVAVCPLAQCCFPETSKPSLVGFTACDNPCPDEPEPQAIENCFQTRMEGDMILCVQCDPDYIPSVLGTTCDLYIGGCRSGAGCNYTLGSFCGPSGIYLGDENGYNTTIVPVCPIEHCCQPQTSAIGVNFTVCDQSCVVETEEEKALPPNNCLVFGQSQGLSVCLQCDANMVPNSSGRKCVEQVGGCAYAAGCNNTDTHCTPGDLLEGGLGFSTPIVATCPVESCCHDTLSSIGGFTDCSEPCPEDDPTIGVSIYAHLY
ncbi:hypothetical protein SARC_01184 [Sphaeroforma arctica JP610]|uniref:Uncharacterized protein n=1 Tax=Sphaeroforma arctica JP610 TaxID=667725 RepID=A0A0L0GEK7_9EUKA|nr:hypothetical protein SARC_01184 [Sphaeroforma arctica JP610]KNC86678.1 hypothetical protein SARC_01184 [Sphaeroforma arctica JP610]|eukprot:XP_014160580.1 hypothetical protein SARC_01184 [Sphaeroforma arctica JP610]